jgi:hypothetical protein
VLCSGEDGHIAIEAAGNSCCNKILTYNSPGGSVSSADEEPHPEGHCRDCVDISISIGLAKITKDRCTASSMTAMTVASAFAAFNGPDPSEYQSLPEPLTPIGYFTPLRSIILLI